MKITTHLLPLLCLVFMVPKVAAYINGKGVVLPNDPYVYIGRELLLMCNLTQPVPEDSSSLYFTRKYNEIIPRSYIRVLSTRSIQLRMFIMGPEDEGSYVCKLNKSSGLMKPEVIGSQYVRVEYEPVPVKKIDCEVYNWQNMTCKWNLRADYVHPELMSITLVFIVGNGRQYDCMHLTPTSCVWKEIEESGKGSFKPDMLYYLSVFVKNTITGDEKQSAIFHMDTKYIVRPASVTDVVIKHNSTCMNIQWHHPDKYHGKIYQLSYKSQWDDIWQNITLNDEKSAAVCNLTPYTYYDINIAAQAMIGGFWSNSVAKTIMMDEGVPGTAPVILPGSYLEREEAKGYYKVLLYWKQIDKRLAHGEIISYKLTNLNMDTGDRDVSFVSRDFKSGWLYLQSQYTYKIKLQGETKAGVSPHTSSIILPAKEKKPGYPRDLLVDQLHVIGQDKRVLRVKWNSGLISDKDVTEAITGYTVYWCKGPYDMQQCREPLHWKKLDTDQTEVIIEVDVDVQLIGVSMETKFHSAIVSSGIIWSSCIYRKNSKPTAAPPNFHLIADQLKRSITVEWDHFKCLDNHGHIKQYLINICLVAKDDNCTDQPKILSVGGHLQRYVIPDLITEARYRVWMQAVSDGGVGPSTSPMFANIHIYGLQAEEIGGIAVAIILVVTLAIVGVIFCVRRMVGVVKDWNKDYPIVLPNLPLPQRPMPELPTSQAVTPDSDSDGIYEKINEHHDSSTPSTPESSLNVPLINNNNNYGSKGSGSLSKSQLYGEGNKRKNYGMKDCSDSGRGSMVSNAESLWSRLHPLRVTLDSKQYGYGQNNNMGTFGHHSKHRRPPHCRRKLQKESTKLNTEDNISPYSCVDIITEGNTDVVNKMAAVTDKLLKCNYSDDVSNSKSGYTGDNCSEMTYGDNNNLVDSIVSTHSDPAYSDNKGLQSIISTHSDPTYMMKKDIQNQVNSTCDSNILDLNNSVDSDYLYPKNNLSRTPSKNKSGACPPIETGHPDNSSLQHFNIKPNIVSHKNSIKGVVDKINIGSDKNTALSLDDLLDSSGARKKVSSNYFDNCNPCEEKNSAVSMDQLDCVPFDLSHKLRKNLDESVNSDDKNLSSSVEEPIYDESWDKSGFTIPGMAYCHVEEGSDFDVLNPKFQFVPQTSQASNDCSKLTHNGYLKHNHIPIHDNMLESEKSDIAQPLEKTGGPRPVSIVNNLPANFYASLSALEMGMATEL